MQPYSKVRMFRCHSGLLMQNGNSTWVIPLYTIPRVAVEDVKLSYHNMLVW